MTSDSASSVKGSAAETDALPAISTAKLGRFQSLRAIKDRGRSVLAWSWKALQARGRDPSQESWGKLVLRVSIQKAQLDNVEADRAQPVYCMMRFAGQSERTEAIRQESSPEWNTTFEFHFFPRGVRQAGDKWDDDVQLSLCTKDRFLSSVLAQSQLRLQDLLSETQHAYDDPANEPKWYSLAVAAKSPRLNRLRLREGDQKSSGESSPAQCQAQAKIQLKVGLVLAGENAPASQVEQVWTSLLAEIASENKRGSKEIDLAGLSVADKIAGKRMSTPGTPQTPAPEDSGNAGIIFLEVSHAKDLPPIKNATHTSFDMDPFVIVSFGLSTFRTRAIRHDLNPEWNEQLHFVMRENESTYKLRFALYDRDKFTSNDFIGVYEVPVMQMIDAAKATEQTEGSDVAAMDLHTVPLTLTNADQWKDHHPELTFRAKFMTFGEIRLQFWRALAKAYDAEANGTLNRMEVQTMLESLGSTLSNTCINEVWVRHNMDPHDNNARLSVERLAEYFEELMDEPQVIKQSTPNLQAYAPGLVHGEGGDLEDTSSSEDHTIASTCCSGDDILSEARGVQYVEGSDTPNTVFDDSESEKDVPEGHVFHLSHCPVCQRCLTKYSQMDVVTHVATCSLHDWTAVDRLVMGNMITEANAQRRWFVKLVNKMGYGKYSVGANNANIIVQDRLTGQLVEERMSSYVRLGMRLIYRGMKTGTHSRTAKRILTTMTERQGRRYDAPDSVDEIEPFVKFYQLNMEEALKPINEFTSFNDFFYRKLKPGARPCEHPDEPKVAVSPADCRMMAFATIDEATRFWIKGDEFSVNKLLNAEHNDFQGGSLAIFRLAPQDYHRFHFPVDGVITSTEHINGQYYTVNPMAIRTTLDVYGENTRTVVWVDSDVFGKVAIVLIGAMMVGSIEVTAEEQVHAKRTDELGYFAFGGSTIVVLWQAGQIQFDTDLLENAKKPLETLVRVGNKIGRAVQ